MHDFSQAESGWISPFVTVSLCPGAVGRAAESKAPPWGGEHRPGVSSRGGVMAGWAVVCKDKVTLPPWMQGSLVGAVGPECFVPAWQKQVG